MDDDLDDMNEFLKNLRARAEQRQAKLEQKETVSLDSVDMSASENREDVSYPPLSPLPEETDDGGSSLEEETERQDSRTTYRRENTSPPSQLDYSSDLSLECDDTNATAPSKQVADFYRAEPVVCHSSPEQVMLQYGGVNNNNIDSIDRKSPRKGSAAQNDFYQQPIHQNQLQKLNPQQRQLLQLQQQQQQQSSPLQEKQLEHKTPSKAAAAAAAAAASATSSAMNEVQLIRDLEKKIYDLTEHRIKQLKKAVTSSGSDSRGVIEAARLLQIAKNEACDCSVHLETLKSGMRKKPDSLGSLKLSNIEFETKSNLKEALALDGLSMYFFCIASCGGEVKATELIDTDSIRRQSQKDYIQFSEVLTFADLPPDFAVNLKVYEFVHKPGHKKISERPREFAERLGLSTPKKSRPTIEVEFNYVGSQMLTQSDRSTSRKPIKPVNGSKLIKPMFKYRMELRPEKLPSRAGMLHVRRLDDNGLRPDWSRFWVDLSEGQINFWKSKQDAQDVKIQRPELTIELKNLCCDTVQKLTPDDDLYRQNSFVIYEIDRRRGGESDTLFQRILDDENCKILKHQFAADNKDDRDAWCFLLDKSVNCFREWNGKTKVFSIDELKELFTLIIQRRGN